MVTFTRIDTALAHQLNGGGNVVFAGACRKVATGLRRYCTQRVGGRSSDAVDGCHDFDTAICDVDTAIVDSCCWVVQARFESVVSNLVERAENSAAARSRIMDADFAAETAALAKNQILQQAGISVLAQANAHASERTGSSPVSY